MQTFLPYEDFQETAKCLDYRRLGKQRVEARQIYSCLTGEPTKSGRTYKGWVNHPAVKMWQGHERCLAQYYNAIVQEWIRRGYNNSMEFLPVENDVEKPDWIGDEDFHASHRSNLLRKQREWYSQFEWQEEDNLPYVWP